MQNQQHWSLFTADILIFNKCLVINQIGQEYPCLNRYNVMVHNSCHLRFSYALLLPHNVKFSWQTYWALLQDGKYLHVFYNWALVFDNNES